MLVAPYPSRRQLRAAQRKWYRTWTSWHKKIAQSEGSTFTHHAEAEDKQSMISLRLFAISDDNKVHSGNGMQHGPHLRHTGGETESGGLEQSPWPRMGFPAWYRLLISTKGRLDSLGTLVYVVRVKRKMKKVCHPHTDLACSCCKWSHESSSPPSIGKSRLYRSKRCWNRSDPHGQSQFPEPCALCGGRDDTGV